MYEMVVTCSTNNIMESKENQTFSSPFLQFFLIVLYYIKYFLQLRKIASMT